MSVVQRKKLGFTLIELLVVISIIGLLSSIVMVYMGGARKKARDARGQADLRQVANAMELKYIDAVPEAYPDLPTTSTAIVTSALLDPYLQPIPTGNGSRTYYWYDGATGTTQKYCLTFEMEATTNCFYASYKGAGIGGSAPCSCPNF